ncbi:MAG: DNA mismatch repair protein MutS, partial [Candidatus Peregrinibacteria bacterium]|nr:DNA mismatch repair protein MutS [Candidatus Peregrinibacteria bacterium]
MSTPVQRQYLELKKQNPDAVLWFRLGDFYEMFFEDAELCSRVLSIQLTARHKGTDNEMPMCGFPHHASASYLEELVKAGYKVAIAEQFEDPETKVITRKVDRVVTPGTTTENGVLQPDKNNFLAAISVTVNKSKKLFSMAFSDASTGEFRTAQFQDEIAFFDELYKVNPAEVLIPSRVFADSEFCAKFPSTSLKTVRKDLSENVSSEILESFFPNFGVFGIDKVAILLEVCAMVLDYLKETQKSEINHISKIVKYSTSDYMSLDAQTFRHLEVFQPIQSEEKNATFLSVFSRAATSMGARKVYEFIARPLLNAEKINLRLDGVQEIFDNYEIDEALYQNLKSVSDLERILARISTGRGSPRDTAMIRDSLAVFPAIGESLNKCESVILKEKVSVFGEFTELFQQLSESLADNPSLEITTGGIFRDGFSAELDELRDIQKNSKRWLDDFLVKQTELSGIKNLRIKFSKNFGFTLEASRVAAVNAPESWIRRQTLTNAERFSTPELNEFEEKFLSAETRAFTLEHDMFLRLRGDILQYAQKIQRAARAIAEVDAVQTFAKTAQKLRWTRPKVLQDSKVFKVKNARHPVVEKLSDETFISNNLEMDSANSRVHLITGPNMAGKSTFLRQNALVILCGQIGSFVPADSAEFGVFDRIFTRVGASDDLAGGKSTFFVEMTETASILNSATDRSFVILDEIGRGTSTFDGIS